MGEMSKESTTKDATPETQRKTRPRKDATPVGGSGIIWGMAIKIVFKPGILPTLATLVLLPVLLSLGMWQWHRADYKRGLQKAYAEQSDTSPLSLAEALSDPEGRRYFPLSISGHYLADRQFLVDNQFYQHQLGYYVLTPFVTDDGKTLLVNRGWVAREAAGKIQLGEGHLRLKGRVGTAPAKTFLLGENIYPGSTWPKTIQAIKLPDLSASLNTPLEPVILLLSPLAANGFTREWQPQGLTPEKHMGYAVQWFAFATLLMVLFVVLNLKKRDEHESKAS